MILPCSIMTDTCSNSKKGFTQKSWSWIRRTKKITGLLFLDLEAHIKDGKFYTKTYDKREAFNFKIVNYPDLSGNIPEQTAYGIYISQVIRYAKICNQTKDFIDRIRLLFNKLHKKFFSKERLLAALKCCRKDPWIMEKHCHGMNNHLANDCWGADAWSWYHASSPQTSVSVHGWRHPITSIKSTSHKVTSQPSSQH